MRSVEDRSVAELELSTKKKTAQNEQKIVYSRDFLLSFALLEVSRRLPEGFDQSVLSELYEGNDGLLEPWKGSGVLYLPNSSISGCTIQSTILQSHCNVDRKIVGNSTWLNKDKNSSEIHDPDNGRYGKPVKPSLNTTGCEKDEAVGKNLTDSGKTSICLLSKSKNPYRPPHAYKVGSTAFEAKSNAEQNTKVKTIPNDDKQEIRHTSKDGTPSCQASNFQASLKGGNVTCRGISNGEPTSNSRAVLEEKVTYSDSEKLVLSMCMDKFSEEQEPSSKSSTEINDFSSCSIEKALPRCLAVTCGSENDISGGLTSPSLKCQSLQLDSIENPEVDQPNKPTADAYLDGTDQRDSLTSKPYEFLIPIGYDYFDSVLRENTTTWINPIGVNTTDVRINLGTCVIDEDQSDFDDLWSDISAVIRFDQLMELYQAADFGIQEESLISNDYPGVTKELTKTDNDIRLPDEDSLLTVDDIRLPDEDSLITVEDMLQPNLSHFTESNLKVDESPTDKDLNYSHASVPVQPYILIETPILLSTYQYPGLDQYYCTNMIHQPAQFKAKSRLKVQYNRVFQSSLSQQPITPPSLQNQHLLLYGGAHMDLVKELVFNNPELDLSSLTNLNTGMSNVECRMSNV